MYGTSPQDPGVTDCWFEPIGQGDARRTCQKMQADITYTVFYHLYIVLLPY